MELSKKNHGLVKSSVAASGGAEGRTVFMESFGKDDSDVTMAATKERGERMGGGINNLAHSLSGTSANQKGT